MSLTSILLKKRFTLNIMWLINERALRLTEAKRYMFNRVVYERI